MSLTEVRSECIRRIADLKGIAAEEITVDSTLESLAVDSLDRVTLAFDLEERYGIQVPETKLQSIRTVNDIALVVDEALCTKDANSAHSETGAD